MHIKGSVQGAITAQDVLRHSFTILRLWGPAAYFRCIRAMISGRRTTFLEVIYPVARQTARHSR